VPYNYQ